MSSANLMMALESCLAMQLWVNSEYRRGLDNKVDELRPRISFQRDIRDCNIFCFTVTWLSWDILSLSIQPVGFSVHRADRT